jgi:hypothetical protein
LVVTDPPLTYSRSNKRLRTGGATVSTISQSSDGWKKVAFTAAHEVDRDSDAERDGFGLAVGFLLGHDAGCSH